LKVIRFAVIHEEIGCTASRRQGSK